MLFNLPHPIKLLTKDHIIKNGLLKYEDCTNFVALSGVNFKKVVGVSHKWLDKEKIDHNDSKHMITSKVPEDSLFFYDYCSIPQVRDTIESIMTFRAALNLMNAIFSQHALIIECPGYFYRYWCFYEYITAAWGGSIINDVHHLPVIKCLQELRGESLRNHTQFFKQHSELPKSLLVVLTLRQILERHLPESFWLSLDFTADPLSHMMVMHRSTKIIKDKFRELINDHLKSCSISFESDKELIKSLMEEDTLF